MSRLDTIVTPDEKRKFIDAYLLTALWSAPDDSRGPLYPNRYDVDDYTRSAKRKATEDCEKFLLTAGDLIQSAIDTGQVRCGPDFDEWRHAGHDFALTRNHHGAGFWDGDWPEPFGDQLTDISHSFREIHVYQFKGRLLIESC